LAGNGHLVQQLMKNFKKLEYLNISQCHLLYDLDLTHIEAELLDEECHVKYINIANNSVPYQLLQQTGNIKRIDHIEIYKSLKFEIVIDNVYSI